MPSVVTLRVSNPQMAQSRVPIVSQSQLVNGGMYIMSKAPMNGVSSGGTVDTSRVVYVRAPGPATVQLATACAPLAKLALVLEVTNIWFGAARCKPSQPVFISENGIKISFHETDSPSTSTCPCTLNMFSVV